MDQHLSRRRFLRFLAAGSGLSGLASLSLPLISHMSEAAQTGSQGIYDWTQHRWAFVVDTTRCIGCGRCVIACNHENDVAEGAEFTRTWIERYLMTPELEMEVDAPEAGMHGFEPEDDPEHYVKGFFVPKLCNQCENPPCVQVCPVGATYQTEDGVVLVDREHCIGCRYCIQACPYGARFLDPRTGVVDKCTWCYHRITKGLQPACVEACPVSARLFGDLDDPRSSVRKILRSERVQVLKGSLGARPKVFYVGLEEGVR